MNLIGLLIADSVFNHFFRVAAHLRQDHLFLRKNYEVFLAGANAGLTSFQANVCH